jgi:hypothetical protein
MARTYEAEIEWSVAGGPSGSVTLRRGYLTPGAAQKGARRYVREQGILGRVRRCVREQGVLGRVRICVTEAD